jgi:hypothetical protein
MYLTRDPSQQRKLPSSVEVSSRIKDAEFVSAAGIIKHAPHSRDVIDYNKDLELLLKDNAEECESLGILHRASYEKYNRLSNYINIPVIILSSAIGFATGIDIGYANMNIILGVGSIFVGIIKSIDTYFQLGKRSESHRLCSLQYQQIHKKIQIELALTRKQRQTAKDMLSVIKTDIKNLQDISPLVDQDIIDSYNEKYNRYTNVKKPNFVNGLTEVAINDTDECGVDVLHSRPRSLSGSNSNSDDGGGGGGGVGGGDGVPTQQQEYQQQQHQQQHQHQQQQQQQQQSQSPPPYTIKPIGVRSNADHVSIDIASNASNASNGSVRSNITNRTTSAYVVTSDLVPPLPPNLNLNSIIVQSYIDADDDDDDGAM